MAERLVRASFQILDILKPDRQPDAAVGDPLPALSSALMLEWVVEPG